MTKKDVLKDICRNLIMFGLFISLLWLFGCEYINDPCGSDISGFEQTAYEQNNTYDEHISGNSSTTIYYNSSNDFHISGA